MLIPPFVSKIEEDDDDGECVDVFVQSFPEDNSDAPLFSLYFSLPPFAFDVMVFLRLAVTTGE